MAKNVISTDGAPKAIGPYSQAVATSGGRLLFCSGQIPLDPATGQMVGTGDVRVQAKQVMENISAVLRAGGASFATIVKSTIFLQDLADFGAVNEIYASYFAEAGAPPARSTVQIAGLPRGALVEVEVIAEIATA